MPAARSRGKKSVAKHRKGSLSKLANVETADYGIQSLGRRSNIEPQSSLKLKQDLQEIPEDLEHAGSEAFERRTGTHQGSVHASTTVRAQSNSDNDAGHEDQAPAALDSDHQQRSENHDLCSVCSASRVLQCCDGCLEVFNEGCSHSSPVFRPGDLAVPWYCEACVLKRAAAADHAPGHPTAAPHDARLVAHGETQQQEKVDKDDMRGFEAAQTNDDRLDRVQEHHELM